MHDSYLHMDKKPVIALLADFPLGCLEPRFRSTRWHYATWLQALHEMFCNIDSYDIHWITFRKSLLRREIIHKGGQTFHVLPVYSSKYAQLTGYVHARCLAARELAHIKPDIVHAWGTENRYAVSGTVFRGKKILSMQGMLTAYVQRAPMAEFVQRQSRKEAHWMRCYDVITTESEWGMERVRELVPEANVVRWEYAARDAFFHGNRSLAETPVCLFGGTDTAVKNLDAAIAAFSSPELADVTLLLAGVTPEKRPNLPKNIVALGGQDQTRLVELLSRTWCLIHPSLADTSPNMVKEARVMGVPVITTTECGGKQYVEEGTSGFIIEPRDVQGLIRAVQAVTKDRETAEQMGRHGQEQCRCALGRETMLRGLCSLYERLLRA